MKAAVYFGPRNIAVTDLADARLTCDHEIPEAFARFSEKSDGAMKMLIRP